MDPSVMVHESREVTGAKKSWACCVYTSKKAGLGSGKPKFDYKKAIEELLKEAKRGKTRAETMGPMGWMKCPLAGTNKRFLINTIKNTLPSQKEQDHEQKEGDEEPAKSQNQKEESRKKHRAHPYKHSFQARGTVSHSPPRKRSSQDKYEKRSHKR